MTVQLKPYPVYKESVAPWIGKVPAHWEVCSNRALFEEINVRRHQTEPLLSVTIARGVVRQADLLTSTSKKDSSNEDKSNYKLVRSGDIVYNKMRAWQGAAGASRFRGLVSPAYIVVRPRRGRPEYFHYLMRTPAFAKEAERWSYGITSDQWSLRPGDFKQIYSPVPPSEEQRAIAAFIERADRGIHRLIRAKRRMIDLLNEQKQAIIHQAVTRGLNPDVRFKPSGIDWLGDIPDRWRVERIRSLAKLVTSGSRGWAEFYSDDGPIFLRIGNVSTSSIELKLNEVQRASPPAGAEGERTRVAAGDVLISITALIGAAGVVPENIGEAYVNQHLALVRPNGPVPLSRWIAYNMISAVGQQQSRLLTNGGTKLGLGLSDVKDLRVLLPPTMGELEPLVDALDRKIRHIDQVAHRLTEELTLLREYRTRLIADIVTGKLDVRGVELPDVGVEGQEDLEMDECLEDAEEAAPEDIEESEEASA